MKIWSQRNVNLKNRNATGKILAQALERIHQGTQFRPNKLKFVLKHPPTREFDARSPSSIGANRTPLVKKQVKTLEIRTAKLRFLRGHRPKTRASKNTSREHESSWQRGITPNRAVASAPERERGWRAQIRAHGSAPRETLVTLSLMTVTSSTAATSRNKASSSASVMCLGTCPTKSFTLPSSPPPPPFPAAPPPSAGAAADAIAGGAALSPSSAIARRAC